MITDTQRDRTRKLEASRRRVTQISAFLDLHKMRERHRQGIPSDTTSIKIVLNGGAEIEGQMVNK
jgi:hypothetical protein